MKKLQQFLFRFKRIEYFVPLCIFLIVLYISYQYSTLPIWNRTSTWEGMTSSSSSTDASPSPSPSTAPSSSPSTAPSPSAIASLMSSFTSTSTEPKATTSGSNQKLGAKNGAKKESFQNFNIEGTDLSDTNVDLRTWNVPSHEESRIKPPVPMQQQQPEMDMFANTEFKPECCPNTFSTSIGCACMSIEQWKSLRERGGNNVPNSGW